MGEWIKILCVDDEPNVLNALRRLFMDDQYTMLTATSARDGLELLGQNNVQIVISDYRMPNMNGVEFLKEVRKRWPDTIRIVLSGYADAASVVSAVNEGQIYKFVPKPWNDDELKIIISHAIERYYLFKKNVELTSELLKVNAELKILLDEKSRNLELRARMLQTNQDIIYSLPVPVMGIDMDNVIVQCNEAWADETGDHWKSLGQLVDHALSYELLHFIEKVKLDHKCVTSVTINGVGGRLFGALMGDGDGEYKGIILVFIREDNGL
jgi:two-component system NtrC family sensor kinase